MVYAKIVSTRKVFMKPKIYFSDWNPFDGKEVEYEKNVSISVDTLEYNKDADIKILYLAEPASVIPYLNQNFPKEFENFDKIYTFNDEILTEYKQSEFIEFGSCWLDFDNLSLDKKNHITFVTSSKNMTFGHKLRQQIYNYLSSIDSVNDLEIYQHKSPPYHDIRNDFFSSAKFHISVENSVQKNYFTEKLIDCFASKTIPIYCGCPNINEFFNIEGILTFNDINELKNILTNINEKLYDEKEKVIEDNYERAKKYYGDNCITKRLPAKIEEYVNA